MHTHWKDDHGGYSWNKTPMIVHFMFMAGLNGGYFPETD